MPDSFDRSGLSCALFDFGGTLDSDGVAWKERFFPLYQQAGLPWDMPEFQRYFFAADDFLCAKKLKDEPFFETLLLQTTLVLKNGGAADPKLAERIARAFHRDSMAVLRRNKPVLEKLARRYRLGIVSNFYGNLVSFCREGGIEPLMGAMIDSAYVGYLKPDPKIFQCAFDALGAAPAECVFVGDSVSRDLRAAKGVGMRHIWMRARLGDGSAMPGLEPCCPEDPVVHSLPELEPLLLDPS